MPSPELTPSAVVDIPTLSLTTLGEELRVLSENRASSQEKQLHLLRILLGLSHAAGAAFVEKNTVGQFALGLRILSAQALTWHPELENVLLQHAQHAQQQQQLVYTPLDDTRQHWLLTVPLSSTAAALCLVLRTGKQPLEFFATVLQLLAGYVPLLGHETAQSDWLLNAQARWLQMTSAPDLLQRICDELADYYGGERVWLGRCRGFHCRLQAGVDLKTIQRQADWVHALEQLMDFTRTQATPLYSSEHAALKKVLIISGLKHIISIPLQFSGHTHWVLVIGWQEKTAPPPELLQPLIPILTSVLLLTQGGHLSLWQKIRKRWRGGVLFGVLLFILSLILTIPVTHYIEGQATLQSSVRRFVTAPFPSVLKTSLREPGDVVAAGDILAVLDGQEVAWTVAGLTAEKNRLLKQKDISAASRDTAAVQVAELEIERVEAQLALQDYRMEHLDIRSPISGVILSGDLKRVQGSPLDAGQSLFEIAPLAEMVVEVAVPVTEWAYIALNLPMTVKLTAYPNETWSLHVQRIHPKITVQDGATVVIVEGKLSNQNNQLRPGMRGKAQIEIGQRALAWVLFYRAWADVRRWLMF
ncbi:efflux RND transporter periplasmic adaptor subunit [Thioflexithrix psekupsensis]|jgi:hypothetical protein|uniref:Uncharacterized protein n=1 Tax=Thioflexithrix psekupsensis TaxID=1570016 RepID=A0A251X766_9GAMM|nr:HlyD family efflux transporter periplasmic adaptor subunit [Thioflexithrix psekupsensis]OUD13311.1 hypothetical protein TPSD3_11850 [Thioflexithrix psekupsensis]